MSKKKKNYGKEIYNSTNEIINSRDSNVIDTEQTNETFNPNTQRASEEQVKFYHTLQKSEIDIEDLEKLNEEHVEKNKKDIQDNLSGNKKDSRTDKLVLTPTKDKEKEEEGIQIDDNENSPIINIPLGEDPEEVYNNDNNKHERRNSEVIEDICFNSPIVQKTNKEFYSEKPIKINIKGYKTNQEIIPSQIHQLKIEPELTKIVNSNIKDTRSKTMEDDNNEDVNQNKENRKKQNIHHNSSQSQNKFDHSYTLSSNQRDNETNMSIDNILSQSYTEMNSLRHTENVPKATSNILNVPKAFVPVKRIPVIYPPKDDSCCIIQ